MSKFYDVICDIKRRLLSDSDSKKYHDDEISALVECAELVYECRKEKQGINAMPCAIRLAISSVEKCATRRSYSTEMFYERLLKSDADE